MKNKKKKTAVYDVYQVYQYMKDIDTDVRCDEQRPRKTNNAFLRCKKDPRLMLSSLPPKTRVQF